MSITTIIRFGVAAAWLMMAMQAEARGRHEADKPIDPPQDMRCLLGHVLYFRLCHPMPSSACETKYVPVHDGSRSWFSIKTGRCFT
jgi:hypothetical protein